MWSRKEIKEKGRRSFKNNFWKTILISLLLIIIGAGGLFGGGTFRFIAELDDSSGQTVEQMPSVDDNLQFEEQEIIDTDKPGNISGFLVLVIAVGAVIFFVLSCCVVMALTALIINPIEVGIRRFFIRNLNGKAQISEIGSGFDMNYKENVKTLFFRDLYILLWTCLLVIPGIVKAYEYRMIPYLLAEDTTMTAKEAFFQSRQLMKGQKWNAFVLDLSFLGWNMLSIFTLGILGILFVNPYRNMTNAALYERLRYGGSL